MPISAFISYSHADESRRDRLHNNLALLRRDGLLSEWSDHEIVAGSVVDDEINAALN